MNINRLPTIVGIMAGVFLASTVVAQDTTSLGAPGPPRHQPARREKSATVRKQVFPLPPFLPRCFALSQIFGPIPVSPRL